MTADQAAQCHPAREQHQSSTRKQREVESGEREHTVAAGGLRRGSAAGGLAGDPTVITVITALCRLSGDASRFPAIAGSRTLGERGRGQGESANHCKNDDQSSCSHLHFVLSLDQATNRCAACREFLLLTWARTGLSSRRPYISIRPDASSHLGPKCAWSVSSNSVSLIRPLRVTEAQVCEPLATSTSLGSCGIHTSPQTRKLASEKPPYVVYPMSRTPRGGTRRHWRAVQPAKRLEFRPWKRRRRGS